MKLEQQYWTIPKKMDERPKNEGKPNVVKDVTFGRAIASIESFCKQLEFFHHYKLEQNRRHPSLLVIWVYCFNPDYVCEDSETGRALPYVRCVFKLKDDDKHDIMCDKEDFNVDKIV